MNVSPIPIGRRGRAVVSVALAARLAIVLGVVVGGGMTGCVSYSNTRASTAPAKPVQLTGSHIPIRAGSAKDAAAASASPVAVYDRSDIDRTGATDLASFLERIPSVRIHR